ncbi:3442_t:CDS:10 [Dentiscutata erythropus]|uniref:P-type H(+)-exporting transporter n=1 Tax=Dentiscutata erythropus TaxID=1348616 RepID=A0A9N9AI60_9GLOM|nr:3442_t:CDS:10 [Dentiscutata erythropus]
MSTLAFLDRTLFSGMWNVRATWWRHFDRIKNPLRPTILLDLEPSRSSTRLSCLARSSARAVCITMHEDKDNTEEVSKTSVNMSNKSESGDVIQENSNFNQDTKDNKEGELVEKEQINKKDDDDSSVSKTPANVSNKNESGDINQEKSNFNQDNKEDNDSSVSKTSANMSNRNESGDVIQEKSNSDQDKKEDNKEDELPEKINEKDEDLSSIEQYLQTDPKTGLTTEEAQTRLDQFGRNEITETKPNLFLKFLSYFRGPIAYLIEVACIVAGIVKDWVDFGIILALLIVNALIGFIEETRAESALEALKQSLALKTKAMRDGKLIELDAAELVPGDIITLRIGNIVPADAKLLGVNISGSETSEYLMVDQSALTGESLPAHRNKGDLVYSSSIIKQGQMLAIVAKTGKDTYIGRAATLMNAAVDQGHFQKVVNKIGTSNGNVLEILQHVLVLTVAAIPVGLPTVLSVTMAVGAKQLAKKQVIIRRLAAVEELASVSVLCSDKTGTLTLNELSTDESWLTPSYNENDLFLYAYICSEEGTDDAIELAVRDAALKKVDVLKNNENEREIPGFKVTSFTPFNPSKKFSEATAINLETQEKFKIVKGAPQVITKLAGGSQEADRAVIDLASRGLRALGVARTNPINPSDNENSQQLKWELVGFLSLLDPPRPDSKDILKKCEELGINIKMVTGDQLIIAKEVANRLGMGRVILDTNHLVDSTKSDEEVMEHCVKADGFAQVTPEHKYRVVELLQKKGYVVGMTGDGVNDAPALKRADVGIAVAGCTDAARSASDIVLLAPGLATIIDGIMTSRAIFQRMRSYSLYRITSTVHFLLFFFCIILAKDWNLPAVLLIMIAMLNDAATLVIAVDNAQISGSPDKWRIGQLITLSIILGTLLMGFSFAHYFIFSEVIKVTQAPHFVIFSTRLSGHFWEVLPSPLFVASILGTQIFAMLISVFGVLTEAIGWVKAIVILAISLGIFVFLDFVKVLVYRYWSLELITKLYPIPSKRKELAARHERSLFLTRYVKSVEKMRKVLLMVRVINAFRQAGDERQG